MMGFLMILAVGFVIWSMINMDPGPDKDSLVVAVKQCPPHKWQYVEVKDTNGDTVKWKIVCDVCGPMQVDNTPRNSGDYS